jgi:hypothetical protein
MRLLMAWYCLASYFMLQHRSGVACDGILEVNTCRLVGQDHEVPAQVDHEIWHDERGIGLLFTFLFYTIQYVPHRQATVLAQGESSTLPVVH